MNRVLQYELREATSKQASPDQSVQKACAIKLQNSLELLSLSNLGSLLDGRRDASAPVRKSGWRAEIRFKKQSAALRSASLSRVLLVAVPPGILNSPFA